MLRSPLIFAFVHILFIISVNTTGTLDSNGYIGECSLTKDDHLSFICVRDFQQTNFFDTSATSECDSVEFQKNQIIEISFENCTMSNIGKPIFEVYKSMNILNASYLGLESLQKELFREAKNLTNLHVSNNNIVELTSFLFVNAGNLSVADFSFNAIRRVDPFAFAGDSKMEALNFSHNRIDALDKQLFDYLPKLKHLDVSHNAITTLGERTFDNLTNLLTLDLSFNDIEQLNVGVFSALKKLTILNLSNAKLSAIEPKTFCHQTKLEILDLSHNNLKVLDIRIFDEGIFLPRLDNLKLLSIGGNQLHELNGYSSTQFPNVMIAGLDQNKFECCDLRKLFRAFHWKQLDLEYDEHSMHPDLLDSKGYKCEFGTDSIPQEIEQTHFSWSEMLVVVCTVVLTVLSVIVISIFKRLQNFREFRTHMESVEFSGRTNQASSNSNIYDIPKV